MDLSVALRSAETDVLPLLDARLTGQQRWPREKALALAAIARSCLEMLAHDRCAVRDVLVQLDVLAGRRAIRRAGRGEEYDPMTGELVRTKQ